MVNYFIMYFLSNQLLYLANRRIFANAHTYHINSISLNSDQETYLSADDLRINLWHLEITDQSFNIVDIKPANMEELTEVCEILFVYSGFKSLVICFVPGSNKKKRFILLTDCCFLT